MRTLVAPLRQRVLTRGEPFELYLSPSFFDRGGSGEVPVWLLRSRGEYAEFALSLLTRLRDAHGIEADWYCIVNEPSNANPFSIDVVRDMIKTLGPRMSAVGLRTRIQFPECIHVDQAWNYVHGTDDDEEMWAWVGLVGYHLYGGKDRLADFRDFALARGLPTAQTEYMSLTTSTLYDDMVTGGVSRWEIYTPDAVFDTSGASCDRLLRKG